MPAKIEIYTTASCPFCVRAKDLLRKNGATFTEIDVTDDDAQRDSLVQRAQGRRTVPQVFIDDVPYGGYDDLAALQFAGKLDGLLKL